MHTIIFPDSDLLQIIIWIYYTDIVGVPVKLVISQDFYKRSLQHAGCDRICHDAGAGGSCTPNPCSADFSARDLPSCAGEPHGKLAIR